MNKEYNRYNLYCECAREAIKFQGLGDDIDEDVFKDPHLHFLTKCKWDS